MKKNKKGKVNKKIVWVLTAVLTILAVGQFILSGTLCADEKELDFLERKTAFLERQNLTLEKEIAASSSLLKIREKAIALGFKENIVLADYTSDNSIAYKQ